MQFMQGFMLFPMASVLIDAYIEKLYVPMCLIQILIRPLSIGYKYTNSISAKYSTDLRKL